MGLLEARPPLSARALGACVAAFVQRHGLLNDEGKPLVLNLSRLRKTVQSVIRRAKLTPI